MKRILQNDTFVGLVLAVIAFVVYLSTLAPTVDFIDSGELAAVATTLGIAHPTGYPLFTLIGYVFAHLPLGLRTICQLNLMSAVLCSIGVFFFYRFLTFVVTEVALFSHPTKQRPNRSQQEEKRADAIGKQIAGGAGALTLAFSETYWSQALSIEVYSLHILFLSLNLYFFTRAIVEHKRNQASRESLLWWYAFALALGLSFTNHMTTILLAPGFLYLYFRTHGSSHASWTKIGRAAVPFLAGLSVYLYLPIRAAQEPVLNWGNPVSLEKFWWHFTGKQYRVWIFSSFESAERQVRYFLENFPKEFAFLPLLFAAFGLIFLFRNTRMMFLYTVILFLGCVLYSINYDIHDIDAYFLLAYAATAVWMTFGVLAVVERIRNRWMQHALAAVIVAMPLYVHYENIDESKNFAVEDYTRNMFASMEPNAVVLSYQWDYFVSAAYYFQLVENVRPDVVVLDKELFRRSWYFQQLENQHPWLIARSRAEVDAFLRELYKFEHDLPYDRNVIQARFEAMIVSFLDKSFSERPVYVTHEVEPEFTKGFRRVPEGLAFRLSRDTTLHPPRPIRFTIRDLSKSNHYVATLKTMYAAAYTNQALLANHFGDRESAVGFLKEALAIKPDYGMARNFLQQLQQP